MRTHRRNAHTGAVPLQSPVAGVKMTQSCSERVAHGHSFDLQLGRSLAAVSPHDAVVAFLDETGRDTRDYPGDLAHMPAVRLPAHVDSAAIQCRRLWGDSESRRGLIPRLGAAPSFPSSPSASCSPAPSASSSLRNV